MGPHYLEHFILEITKTQSPLSRKTVSVLGLTNEHSEVTEVMEQCTECFTINYSDTCFICFLLSLKLDLRDLALFCVCFCFSHCFFYKSQSFVIKIFASNEHRETKVIQHSLGPGVCDWQRRLLGHQSVLSLGFVCSFESFKIKF